MSVKVLKTNDTWYGMTYHEDVAAVKDSFKKMFRDFERRSAGTDGGDEFYRRSVCGFPGSLPGHSGN